MDVEEEKRQINVNYRKLAVAYSHNRRNNFKKDIRHCVLEGGSRSGKTISCIDFIIYYCMVNSGKSKQIFCIRETYASHKTTLYNDFSNRLSAFGLKNPFPDAKEISQFSLFGNNIYFMGADKESKFMGAGCHLAFFNEMIDLESYIFDQVEQRTKEMWIGDYNPKLSVSWIYDKVLKREDVIYVLSTFSDNPYISEIERKKILSYRPTAENIENGTADDYRWQVYGLGKRMAPEGLIFQHVKWVDALPDEIQTSGYGLDFGYTNDPAALVKYGEDKSNIYLEGMFYAPLDSAAKYDEMLRKCGVQKTNLIACDGADPDMVRELRNDYGWSGATAVKKPKGSIKHGISLLKKKRLNIVRDKNFKREQENYRNKVISGITLDEPVDKFNHYWDAARYIAEACRIVDANSDLII